MSEQKEMLERLNRAFGSSSGGKPRFRAEDEEDDYLFGRRAAEVRSTDTTEEGDDLPAPCSEECGWCGENMPRDTTGSAEQ